MSKPSAPRREADNEAKAVLRAVRISPRKLDLVAATIRGKKAATAVNELTFSKKRIARDVKKALNSAIANAENNHNLDVDRLVGAALRLRHLLRRRCRNARFGLAAGLDPVVEALAPVQVDGIQVDPGDARTGDRGVRDLLDRD